MALPEFQRGYVWNRDEVRGLFDSLYKRHPVGGLLVWATESNTATHRGDGALAAGVVKLLLDGQQRMTSLYGVVRGKPPKFFDGNAQAFTGLRFHLGEQVFAFYQPVKMKEDPLWIDVTALLGKGSTGLGELAAQFGTNPELAPMVGEFIGRLSQLFGITEIDLHIEEVTGADKTLNVVVDIFNRVNSGGTKLSKGDLALAKICADWPEGRDAMKAKLKQWSDHGYSFNLDWLLRSVNTVLTGEAKFLYLHDKSTPEIQDAFNAWMAEQLLPPGTLAYDFPDPDTAEQRAVFHLAWPSCIQAELSQPVAVLLNEGQETLATVSGAGFRCFTSPEAFQAYVLREIISEPQAP
jgi:hypothetical protein